MTQELSYVDWSEFKQEKYPRSMRLEVMNNINACKREKCGTWNPSPHIVIKPLQNSVRIFHILLCLLPHVKDRAILTRA